MPLPSSPPLPALRRGHGHDEYGTPCTLPCRQADGVGRGRKTGQARALKGQSVSTHCQFAKNAQVGAPSGEPAVCTEKQFAFRGQQLACDL